MKHEHNFAMGVGSRNNKIARTPKEKKVKIMTVVVLLILLVSIIGVSYSAWKYVFSGNENKIETGDVSLKLLESNKNIIGLNNSLPMSDEEGIKQTETGNVFDFSVETKASFNINIGYKINIEKLSAEEGYTSLEDNQIKIYLTDGNDNKIIGPIKISELNNYNLYEDMNIHTKDNNVQIDKYKIRVWIDKDVDASSWTKDTKQEYKFRIGVSSTDKEGTYNISYSPNGGEGQMAPSIYNENTEELLRKNTLTRGGYTFKGWSTTNNGEVEYQDQTKATNLTTGNDKNKTLYAVWQPNTYTVKYHSNGGLIKTTQTLEPDVNYDPVNMGTNNTKWTKEGNVYKSGNLSTSDATYLLHSITLEEAGTLSFEVAVSQSENYEIMFLLSPPNFSNPIEQKSIKATPGITKEDDLVYQKIEIPLEAGSYGIVFGPFETPSESEGLDRAYVRNIEISNSTEGQVENSTYTVGQNNKLKKNEYKKEHYTFKGWDTNKNVSEPKYKDENDLTKLESKVTEDEQIDLYAIWEINKYTVNVVVQNGTINENSTKQVEYNKNGVFNLTSNIDSKSGKVTCTNGQSGILENGVLTIKNVSDDTTCTANFIDSVTTLYEDGTLIINEKMDNRSANISTHGAVAKEYDAMSNSNSYVFTGQCIPDRGCTSDALWFQERNYILNVEIGSNIKPISTANWFIDLSNMQKGDFINLDTSSVTDMSSMFEDAGYSSTTFELKGLENWDVSKVTGMNSMFLYAGSSATTFNLNLSNWNTSSVTDMGSMFASAGRSATSFELTGLENWDVSKVTSMGSMFSYAGYHATTFNLNLSNWDTSSVTNMSFMFASAGRSATSFELTGLENWNVSKVTDMSSMFYYVGYSATTFNMNLSNWDTSKVTDMNNMFASVGASATSFELTGLENWDVSNVTSMGSMFSSAALNATSFELTGLENWNVSKVTNISSMFYLAGPQATTWSIGDLSKWDTSSVTDMSYMFDHAGSKATTFNLDLTNWNTSSVTDMSYMFDQAGSKATTFNLDLTNWNTSSVTDMSHMFYLAGPQATTWSIGDLSKWDTSKVTDMNNMFASAGKSATTFDLNLSKWDTSKVTAMSYMFDQAGSSATTWTVKIPSKTGDSTNTTSRWYGSSSRVYATPCSGKSFTLNYDVNAVIQGGVS